VSRRHLVVAAAGLLGATWLAPCASTTVPTRPVTQIPWRPGHADAFQTGAPEERRARAPHGFLTMTIHRPEGVSPRVVGRGVRVTAGR
jgi:hypothetical protein